MYPYVRYHYANRWPRRLLLLVLLLAVFGLAWRFGQAARAAKRHQPAPIGMVV